ncbi:uncharacterized protein LOC112146198 isoform X2 [Oryzias melastigma]|uniref:uncharacterized protein LOC112146198 isoform X2 n=1 Tax=Oryzias melastigma TaxID=30732 RepID=UPI00168D990A|nr:uncharacterized protein LOC112146198 isoform X2 [Oryzias melastigma]
MSVNGTSLLFEGFLQKRKDTLKLRWVTYWFRLQNTTLFFYNEKNCDASTLKGYYYIYTVQSVREIPKATKKHFMFEIILTNGKCKMLAAQTAALRKQWVEHLWEAMRLSTNPGTHHSMMPLLPAASVTPSHQIYPEARIHEKHSLDHESHSIGFNGEDHQSYEYDVLPCRGLVETYISFLKRFSRSLKSFHLILAAVQKISTPTKMDDLYDSPRSCIKHAEYEEPTYDIPSSHLRTTFCTLVSEESSEEETH